MSIDLFNFVLNIVILLLLGPTIFYAARLSLRLRALQDSKADLDATIRNLSTHIEKAERSVNSLRMAAQETGTDLQEAVDNARSISDELQLMTESGDRLAARIEKLADNGASASVAAATAIEAGATPAKPAAAKGKGAAAPAKPAAPQAAPASGGNAFTRNLKRLDKDDEALVPRDNFMIRDPEVERGIDPVAAAGEALDDIEFSSEAERDLYRAMRAREAKR